MASISKGVEDLSQLERLDEDSIQNVLRDRYAKDEIYTNCGEILIAVNPYKKLGIFDFNKHEQYDWKKFEASAPPHIFNVAARAYQRMRETETNQVILVSGESGAGKTESTKLMVKHFVHMCPHGNDDLHDKVVKVNPLLEAFGNAQTIMNENSSRFAKFLELSFEENGQVLGAVVRDYMLEKSRVVNYSYDEGNFHIFYSLFAGASQQQLEELSLKEAKDYKILKNGSPELLNKTTDYTQMYTDQMSVLQQIGFDEEDMSILHCMLGAIIHITEVKFREAERQNEALEIVNLDHVNTAAKLLNVNPLDLGVALIKTKTDYGGEEIHVLKSLNQANDGRDALAKAIYERLFGWVIRTINDDLNPSKQRSRIAASIGVLDIAGFENLHVNSFEQLCINFVNERLQNFMNESVFRTEKAIYKEDGIPCQDVDFKNNKDIIEIFTKKSIGILSLLDEETKLQQGSDEKFVQKVTSNHSDSGIIMKSTTNDPVFGINHFAGKVLYRCEGFLEKNKDTLNDDLFDCMKDSENPFIKDLFTVAKGPTGTISETQFHLRQSRRTTMALHKSKKATTPRSDDVKKLSKELGRSMKRYGVSKGMMPSYSTKKHNTVISYFRASMDKLLEKMRQAEAHFVRCIKPNNMKQKENFSATRVNEQLLYNGITEVAKIRKQGYPVRKLHTDFYKRYSALHPDFPRKTADDCQGTKSLVEKILPDRFKAEYRVGKHRIFMKESPYMFLEKFLYIREQSARRSMATCIFKMWSEKKAAEELKAVQRRKKVAQLQSDMEKEDAEKEIQERRQAETKRNISASIGSTTSTRLGASIGSTLSSTQGSSSSDTSSSGRVQFASLSHTRKPDGGTKSIPSPSDYSESHGTEFGVNEQTGIKQPWSGPSHSGKSGAGPSPKGKAPPPPKRSPPPRKKHPPETEKKKESKAFWDIFANIPREKKSKDVHERGSLRVIKVITYGLLFLVMFASLVFQKISLMLLAKRQDKDFIVNEGDSEAMGSNDKFTDRKNKFEEKEHVYNSARYLLLLLAVCIPYVLTFVFSVLKTLFGNLAVPSKSTIIMVTFMECAHSVGLSYLVFKYLGEMHSARGIMVMSATCILPSILKPFFAKDDSTPRRNFRIFKRILGFAADLMAIIAQISVIPVVINNGFLLERTEPSKEWQTVLEVVFCLLLCSFSWWENFMDDRAFGSSRSFLQQFVLKIKFDLQESRPIVTTVTSLFKIGLTIAMAYVLRGERNMDVSAAMSTLTDDRYENVLPEKLYEHYNYIKDYTSIICITIGSYLAYYVSYTICKLRMQVVSFSMAALLSTPVAVGIVVLDCEYQILEPFTKEQLYCYPKQATDSYGDSHWYHFLLGLLWLISAYWIAKYIWFSKQERLAKIDRLFINPLYCSVLLEQHLLMNRRRHNKRIRREFEGDKESYRLSNDDSKHAAGTDRSKMRKIPPMIYACATMWHENRLEMVQILKSLYRVDMDQFIRKQAVDLFREQNPDEEPDPEDFEYYEFQAHILFDDAFEFDDEEDRVPNSFVKLFMEVMQEAANAIHHKEIKLATPMKIPSPYGAQLVFDLPGENMMYVHLKDKNKIRHRKRWSQVMYMYYLLGYRIIKECQERVLGALADNKISELATWDYDNAPGRVGKSQIFNILDDEVLYRAENTFILALDGDVDFTPKAVRLLVDRMQKNEELGAACGRIHPIGKGPMVWYQKFEYAVAHWLQKSTEHVLGCVLCSPGCFSLFRGSALMDDNIMRKYTIKPTEASHHLMYDQGEDRWLCTLLLQQGYRVDYAAASDAYTYAPEGFGEFFNQRRRWMPSTIANIMDLLADASNTVSINNNISWLYMFYQGALMVSTLIGPSTVIMMIAGSYLTVFNLDLLTSYAIALTPAFIYTILCFTVKPKYQIMVAEILSAVYSFIMMVVFVGCIITAVRESPFHPSVIFLCAMVFIFLFAAVLHPWEFSCIIYGVLYFLCVPSGFLLLVIYSLVNMNIVSWGTREVPKKKTKAEIEEEEKKRKEKDEKKKQGWFSRFMPKFQLQDLKSMMEMTKKEDKSVVLLEQMNKNMEMFMKLQGKSGAVLEEVKVDEIKPPKQRKSVTFAGSMSDSDSDEETEEKRTKEEELIYQKEKKKRNDLKNPKWLELKEFQFGHTMQMNEEEVDFWQNFIKKYLEPLDANKDEQKKVTKELAELRNNVAAGFAFINLIWVAINFMFQLRKPAVITFPMGSNKDDVDEDNIKIDALGLMFVVYFVVILLIQFIGMIVHRWGTFMHLIAITEIPNPCKKDIDEQVRDNKDRQRNARDMIRLCEEIVGEPMPDYPSDEEEEDSRDRAREELLRKKIENNATQGVSENLRESQRNPGIGRSLRNTRAGNLGSTRTRLGETVRDGNFKRMAKTILARTQREVNNSEESGFKPNNLRKRGKTNQDPSRMNSEPVRKFGHNTPVFTDFMEKVNERQLNTMVEGAERNGGNLGGLRSTYNPRNAGIEDEESIYDEIPGAGTLGRAFQKKIHKMAKTGVRPSDRNGPLQYSNNIEMHHRDVEIGNRL
ncbi:CHS1 [Mytilus coruscus]|uniref:chitin synthase n=1 Tax=Mytilus coruscus TaxID=42192 RepID=A0A6J8EH38_MYTCO|nr:CHS1 [Mytilus coruscus]